MRCVVCRQADVRPGEPTVTLDREGPTLVIKHVPARVCPNCGEEYVDEAMTARAGALVDVREYVAAA
jgi:YgiT-type zinc finger domain-containing protein